MADLSPSPVLVPTPSFTALPGLLQQVPVHDVDGHVAAAGVVHENGLLVTHGHSFTDGVDKALLEEFGISAASTTFNAQRIDYLPVYLEGGTDQAELARSRFAMWESFDVEAAVTTILDGLATSLGSHDITPEQGLAALLNAISQHWPYQPLVLSGRGPEVRLERNGGVSSLPMKIAYGSAIGPFTADGHGRMYVMAALELYRAPITVAPFTELDKNRAGALVERIYTADVFGPVYSIDVQYADAEVS